MNTYLPTPSQPRPPTPGQIRYLKDLIARDEDRAYDVSQALFGFDVTRVTDKRVPAYFHVLNAKQASDYIEALER